MLGFGSACCIGAGPPPSPPHRDVHFTIEDNGQNWPIESEVHVSMRRTRPWQTLGSGRPPLLIDHDDEFEAGGCSVLLQKVRHVDFDRGFRDGEGFGYIRKVILGVSWVISGGRYGDGPPPWGIMGVKDISP